MTDPETALNCIRRRIDRRRARLVDIGAMHDALSELLATHQPDDAHAYCRGCGEPWRCDTYETIRTALEDVTP